MARSALDSYLLGNKAAVKTGIKLSVSIWGALFIALLMNFEHPVWAMITGMVSFFAPDHAQVLKKCVYQCLSTVLGGIAGVVLMGFVAQSPLLAGLGAAVIVFLAGALSYHSRDANFTFVCAIFTVTICIMIMVPVRLGGSSEVIAEIFVDRVGTIVAGICWASFISACLWPIFTSDLLRQSSARLFSAVMSIGIEFEAGPAALQAKLAAIYSSIIENADFADHCDFEGQWGKRGARVARELNKLAVQISSGSYALHQFETYQYPLVRGELAELDRIVRMITADGKVANTGGVYVLDTYLEELNETLLALNGQPSERLWILEKVERLAQNLRSFVKLYVSLVNSERVSVEGMAVKRYLQWGNCLITGARSALLFLMAYGFWYATDWINGFLIAVVPVVFSMMLGKLPHPEHILKNIVIGGLVAIPFGLLVNSILGQASSAIELLILTAGVALFFGLMGLSSLMSFAYSLGFNISYMAFVLPTNTIDIDMAFPIERSLCVAVGAAMLAMLYIWLPRKRVMKEPDNVSSLFADDLKRFLLSPQGQWASSTQLAEGIGLMIDKMVYVTNTEAPEKRAELMEEAGRAIFLMTQARQVFAFMESHGVIDRAHGDLDLWRGELFRNYINGESSLEHPLVDTFDKLLSSDGRGVEQESAQWRTYVGTMDKLTRSVFAQVQQAT